MPAPAELLTAVAERRAAGQPWPAIAAELGADPAAIRRLPTAHRKRWRAALVAATQALAAEALAEVVLVLRRHLRSDDQAVSLKAADALARVYSADRPKPVAAPAADAKPRSEWHRIADLLADQTDDEIAARLARRPGRPAPPG